MEYVMYYVAIVYKENTVEKVEHRTVSMVATR